MAPKEASRAAVNAATDGRSTGPGQTEPAISVEDARRAALSRIRRLEPEPLDLLESLGCVLASDVVSDIDMAPFDNSAMDGYAVRAGDTAGAGPQSPVVLRVVDHIAAGSMPVTAVRVGEASRIMTGAAVPAGADAIVMVEDTRALEAAGSTGGTVAVLRPATVADHIRLKGEDVRIGDTVLHAGEVLNAASVGLLAALGVAAPLVFRRPHVAIVPTGDELVGLADSPGPGKIRNSNSYSLAAQVEAAGGVPHILGIAHDTVGDTRALLERAPAFDLMITTGGVNMGDFDVVREVLDEIGELEAWKAGTRRWAPQTYGTIGPTPFFGLSGNPTSTVVGFEMFVRPAIRKMRGLLALDRPRVRAVLSEDVRKRSERRYYTPGVLAPIDSAEGDRSWAATVSGSRSSATLSAMLRANCLVPLPGGVTEIKAGTIVDCIRLDQEEGTP